MKLLERLDVYERLMRLDKPIGILLLLWPTLWALLLAGNGKPELSVVWIFILGTVLMRSAGCVMNDIADRNFDPHVERTRNRPLASGAASVKEALVLAGFLSLLALLLILPLNFLVWQLAVVALFLAVSYPFTKRFFAIPQACLGIAFGFGIPMAYAALQGRVPSIAWWMLLANIFWAMAYDTEYALVDREDDLRIGIRTSAITFGRFDIAAIMLCYAMMLALLAWIGGQYRLGIFYYMGLAVAAVLMAYHYTLIRSRSRERCFKAFLHNNWVGASICAGLLADFHLRPLIN